MCNQQSAIRQRGPLLGGVLLAGLLLLAFGLWWLRSRPASSGGATAGPALPAYRNLDPDVPYVGSAVCGECHLDKQESYRQHPMGRSFATVAQAAPVERYEPAAHNPFAELDFQFEAQRQGPRLIHWERRIAPQGQVVLEFAAEVQYVIGSGTRGRTYLLDHEGYLFQSPLSWYTQPGVWDRTPGMALVEHTERPARPECLFCHCDRAELVPHTLNRYRRTNFEAIGCERCHGPGALHVQRRQAGEEPQGLDDTIVNPRDLPASFRESVCQQCHLHGESRILRRDRQLFAYRPGMALDEVLAVFVRSPQFDPDRAVADHTEQMQQSRCYQASNGQLGCTSCHDPHRVPAAETKASYYRQRCLRCHQEESCHLPGDERRSRAPGDACTVCHMPRATSKIVHTAATDHRLRRRPEPRSPAAAPVGILGPERLPIVPFHADPAGGAGKETARELGLALTELCRDRPSLAPQLAPVALPLVEQALARAPDDVYTGEARGLLLWLLDRKEEGLAALDTALAHAPERELTLTYAAALATALERSAAAIAYWERARAADPWNSQYSHRLAKLLAIKGRWPEAEAASAAALRLNPISDEIRLLHVTCLLHVGKTQQAQRAFAPLLALRPTDRATLERWFAEQQR